MTTERVGDIEQTLLMMADEERRRVLMRFFKTGKGQYGEGDRFLGVTNPQVRSVVKLAWKTTSAIAFGTAAPVTDEGEKIEALRLICRRFLPHHMDAFDAAIARSLARTAVVRITLTAPPTGKCKQYDPSGNELKYGRMP